jgi:Mor family transcriptional regulator
VALLLRGYDLDTPPTDISQLYVFQANKPAEGDPLRLYMGGEARRVDGVSERIVELAEWLDKQPRKAKEKNAPWTLREAALLVLKELERDKTPDELYRHNAGLEDVPDADDRAEPFILPETRRMSNPAVRYLPMHQLLLNLERSISVRPPRGDLEDRNAAIVRLHNDGMLNKEIAAKYEKHPKTIGRVLKAEKLKNR